MVIADCFLFCFQGNRLFKEGKYELAKAKYEKVWSPWYCLVFNVLQSYPSYNWNLFDCVAAYFDKLWCLGYWWTLNDLLHLYIKCSPQKVMYTFFPGCSLLITLFTCICITVFLVCLLKIIHTLALCILKLTNKRCAFLFSGLFIFTLHDTVIFDGYFSFSLLFSL